MTYKKLREDLDKILQKFEQSEYEDVDELIADYESAINIISKIERYLDSSKEKINKVKKI